MKTKILVTTMVCLLFASGPAFGQGSLTPPGPPAPTMKSLDQIEPRTPILTLPYTISAPGSYYLATNGTVTGTGIHVQSSDVTLDLNGFTITGDGGATDYGVLIDPTTRVRNITVRNGKMVYIGGVVVGGQGADNVLIEGMQVYTNSRAGIWIGSGCVGAIIRNNLVVGGSVGGQGGINLTAFTNQPISGVTILNNRISGTPDNAIIVSASNSTNSDISLLNNQISDNSIFVSASGVGVVTRLLIDGNHVTRSSGFGLTVPANARATVVRNVLTGCTFSVNTTGNTIGPIVSTVGTLGTTGADMSPWANFQN
jgi:Right handed beta helix region